MDFEDRIAPFLLHSYRIVLYVAVVLGPLAGLVRKGGAIHRNAGRLFVWCLVLLFLIALPVGLVLWERFWLAAISFMALYSALSGYRVLYLKRLHQGQRPEVLDYLLHSVGGAFHAGLLIWGVSHFALGERGYLAQLFLMMGIVGSLLVANNFLRFYRNQHDKRDWLFGHIAGMITAYVVVVCIISALHLEFIGSIWLQWLWPVAIGLPLIVRLSHKYKERFLKGGRIRDVADVRIR